MPHVPETQKMTVQPEMSQPTDKKQVHGESKRWGPKLSMTSKLKQQMLHAVASSWQQVSTDS